MTRDFLKRGVIGVLFWLCSGCATAPLHVGTVANYPPVAFQQGGQPAGIEADLARQMEKDDSMAFEFIPMEFDRLMPALLEKRIDIIMGGMSVTPARQEQISFTEPYLRVGQMLLIREHDLARFHPARINQPGLRVGVGKGTTGESFARERVTEGTVIAFASPEEGIAALEQGTIDCFLHDAPTIWRFSADASTRRRGLVGLYEPLTVENLAWGVRKEDTALLTRLNEGLEKMRQSGMLDEIVNRWIRTRVMVGGSLGE